MKFGKTSAIGIKTEIKSYKGNINAKEGPQCIYMSIILIDSVYRKDKNYYPLAF